VKILYTILTCTKTQLNADACRDTWVQDIRKPHDWFFYGDTEQSKKYSKCWDCEPDTGDTYDNLPKKTLNMLKMSLQYDWDYIYKCDDDTYVVPSRLERLLSNREPQSLSFIGQAWSNKGNPKLPWNYAAGGAGYVISRAALVTAIKKITYVCEKSPAIGMNEDMAVSKALWLTGINLESCELLSQGLWVSRQQRKGNLQWLADTEKTGLQEILRGNISTHHINYQSMYKIHNKYKGV
jgi:hypothetical protein